MNFTQRTFGNFPIHKVGKYKQILTTPEGSIELTDFDSIPNPVEVVRGLLDKVTAVSYKGTKKFLQTCPEPPEGVGFWDHYPAVRKVRVAQIKSEFNRIHTHLQMAGYYSKAFPERYSAYNLNRKDGVRKGDLILTEEEVSLIINKSYPPTTIENKHKQIALDIFILALFTGARYCDIRHMVPSTDTRGNPIILYHNHKGTSSMEVALLPACVGPLQRGLYKTGIDKALLTSALRIALFEALPQTSNRLVNYYWIRPGQGRILRNTPRISEITFHTARHTFCCRCLRAGMTLKAVAALVGHKNFMTTMRYYAWINRDESNDILRKIHGADVMTTAKREFGQEPPKGAMPLEAIEAMMIRPSEGAPAPTDSKWNEKSDYWRRSRQRGKAKPKGKRKAVIEEAKRLGLT